MAWRFAPAILDFGLAEQRAVLGQGSLIQNPKPEI
jgi:hypothetical protein